ncbi:hypothetical protein [Mesorhizobium sp. M0203]|uniref:hypothetical protein n=1 Tax=Mesorhizobium sp. M0203 TaxID=2956912 RepID=UPI0033354119
MAEIDIISIDMDGPTLDEETRALFKRCLPSEPVDLASILTPEKIDEAMVAAGLVQVH